MMATSPQQPRLPLLGIVPRENIVGRPLFNYWSFVTPEDQYEQPGVGNTVAWLGHVALHSLPKPAGAGPSIG